MKASYRYESVNWYGIVKTHGLNLEPHRSVYPVPENNSTALSFRDEVALVDSLGFLRRQQHQCLRHSRKAIVRRTVVSG